MNYFTYKDYIKAIHTLRLNHVLQLSEEDTYYNTKENKVQENIDNLIKEELKNKQEVINLIKQFIGSKEELVQESLINWTSKYIINKYKEKQPDVIYKIKEKNTFILIQYQQKIDNKILYKLLNYCIDIMLENNRFKKDSNIKQQTLIIPIIIYTGKSKWKTTNDVKINKYNYYQIERYKEQLKYNLIDINKLSKKDLIEKNTNISKLMLLKKCENEKELIQNLELIIQKEKRKDFLKKILNYISYSNEIIQSREKEMLIKKIQAIID